MLKPLFHMAARRLCGETDRTLLQPFAGFAGARPEATWIPGAKEVEGIVARRAAEKAFAGNLGKILYFTGGVRPWGGGLAGKFLASQLIPAQTRAGISPPQKNEREGEYGARVFAEELKKLGGDANDFEIRVAAKGAHFQANLAALAEPAEWNFAAHSSIGFMALPYAASRLVGTARKSAWFADAPVIVPMLAWLPEIGITPETHRDSVLAGWMLRGEFAKTCAPTPETSPYARKGFFQPPDWPIEQARVAQLAEQRPALPQPDYSTQRAPR